MYEQLQRSDANVNFIKQMVENQLDEIHILRYYDLNPIQWIFLDKKRNSTDLCETNVCFVWNNIVYNVGTTINVTGFSQTWVIRYSIVFALPSVFGSFVITRHLRANKRGYGQRILDVCTRFEIICRLLRRVYSRIWWKLSVNVCVYCTRRTVFRPESYDCLPDQKLPVHGLRTTRSKYLFWKSAFSSGKKNGNRHGFLLFKHVDE